MVVSRGRGFVLVLLVALVAVASGCAASGTAPAAPGEPAASSASPPTPATQESPTASPGSTPHGATSTVTATLTSVDDVEGGGRAPGSATVLILPAGRAVELWEDIEFTPDDQSLPTVGGLVDAGMLDGMVLADATDGRFTVDVDHGDHLVCLLAGTGPFMLQGCARTTVDGPATWEITRGEGGVSLSP